MNEVETITIVRWVAAVPFLGFGAWVLLFNMLRQTRFGMDSEPNAPQRIPSSVPLWGSALVLFGLYLAPIPFRPAFGLILILEIFSVNFLAAADSEEGDEG